VYTYNYIHPRIRNYVLSQHNTASISIAGEIFSSCLVLRPKLGPCMYIHCYQYHDLTSNCYHFLYFSHLSSIKVSTVFRANLEVLKSRKYAEVHKCDGRKLFLRKNFGVHLMHLRIYINIYMHMYVNTYTCNGIQVFEA
jgi:hypothetical protein